MKSSYELAMERLTRSAPATKLSTKQKVQIAELESICKAKIAEREIAITDEAALAAAAGEHEKAAELQQRLVNERKKLQGELEEKKQAVRRGNV